MKNILIISGLLLCCISGYPQEQQGKVTYDFIANGEKKTMVLFFDDSSSLCVYNKEGWDTNYAAFRGALFDSSSGFGIKVNQYDSTGALIYRNFRSEKLVVRQTKVGILNAFIVRDNWVTISWELLDEEEIIAGYTCRKAIGNFRGRQYTAWYAPDLKNPYGPWKLFGLPGLILEAHDKEKVFRMTATAISWTDTTTISEPFEPEIKTLEEYVYYLDHSGRLVHEKLRSKPLPKGIKIGDIQHETPKEEVRNKSLEKVFEWEDSEVRSMMINKN